MSKYFIFLSVSVLAFLTGCQEAVKSHFIPGEMIQDTELTVSIRQKKISKKLGFYIKPKSSFAIVKAERISSPGSRVAFGAVGIMYQDSVESGAIKEKIKPYEEQLEAVGLAEITKTAVTGYASENHKVIFDDGKKSSSNSMVLKPYAYIVIDKNGLTKVFVVIDGSKSSEKKKWTNSYIYYHPGWIKLYGEEGVFNADGMRIKEICKEGVNQIVQCMFDDTNGDADGIGLANLNANFFSLWEDNDRLLYKSLDGTLAKENDEYVFFEVKDRKKRVVDGLHIIPRSEVMYLQKKTAAE